MIVTCDLITFSIRCRNMIQHYSARLLKCLWHPHNFDADTRGKLHLVLGLQFCSNMICCRTLQIVTKRCLAVQTALALSFMDIWVQILGAAIMYAHQLHSIAACTYVFEFRDLMFLPSCMDTRWQWADTLALHDIMLLNWYADYTHRQTQCTRAYTMAWLNAYRKPTRLKDQQDWGCTYSLKPAPASEWCQNHLER